MRDKETGEITEHRMSYKVLDEFLQNNPNLEVYHSAGNLPIMSDASRMSVPGLRKADSGFEKNVIARIREKVPGNTLSGHKTSGHNISEY